MKCVILLPLFLLSGIHLNSSSQPSTPPINTQIISMGQLHPRIDFAGVIIDLNVKDAISRGNISIELTNKYLTLLESNRQYEQVEYWTGHNRHIHFMVIKRNRVLHNLRKLEADLHTANEQYRIPTFDTTIVPLVSTTPRPKRSIDIEFDVNKCLSTVVDGIVSLFAAPRSLDKIQKSVEKISYRTSRLESSFVNFTSKVDNILDAMRVDINTSIDEVHMIASLTSALSLADDAIMELLSSITPLVKGELTHNLLDPLQSQSLIEETQTLADKLSLEVVVTKPVDILKCSVTSFATKDTWFAMLSIPLVHRSETMLAYQFINIPWFYNNISVQWDIQSGVIASTPGLYPDIRNVFIPANDLNQLCDKFNENYLCHKRINHFPTCQISLMYHHTDQCSLKLADAKVRYSYGPYNYLFFQNPTQTLVKCPGKKALYNKYHGLLNFDEISQCKITTKSFTLLPKSSPIGLSSAQNNRQTVTVLDNEWTKVAIAFDGNTRTRHTTDPTNPWHRMEILTDNNQDIRIFGSHTILVHSVIMFLILSIVLTLLAICVKNYFDYDETYTPKDIDSSHVDLTSLQVPGDDVIVAPCTM